MKKFFALTLALVCVAGLSLGCKPAEDKAAAPATDAPTTDAPSQPGNPDTSDAVVIAIAAVACVALAGAVISKKIK